MAKKMEITFERGGRFVATLFEDVAPETSKAVWEHLPIETQVGHSIYSGNTIWLHAFGFKTVENPRRLAQPGDVFFDTHILPVVMPAMKDRDQKEGVTPSEILFAYGPDVMITDKPGIPTACNYFAKITEGDLNELKAVAHRLMVKEKVTLRRMEKEVKSMAKKMEITFERGGRFVATLFEDVAPETSKAVWEHLPIETQVGHSIYSGNTIWLHAFGFKTVENPRRLAQPGDVFFDTHILPVVMPAMKNHDQKEGVTPSEILFAYGPDVMITDKPGIPTACNYFAKITEGDLNELKAVAHRLMVKEKVTLRRL